MEKKHPCQENSENTLNQCKETASLKAKKDARAKNFLVKQLKNRIIGCRSITGKPRNESVDYQVKMIVEAKI